MYKQLEKSKTSTDTLDYNFFFLQKNINTHFKKLYCLQMSMMFSICD